MNQPDGFDCPGCAWPEPPAGERSAIEFCENGAKALAWEADRARADAAFFARHSVAELAAQDDHWLGQQGRLVEPMWLPEGATHYQPIAWDDAFARVAGAHRRARRPGAGGLLHVRADQQRGGVPLPAVRARARHQQPARLLEPVSRVQRRRAEGGDRRRQGDRSARRLRARRRHPDHRPEPGHQPPAHDDDAAGRRAPRLPDRRDQPAARGGAVALRAPAAPAGGAGRRHADRQHVPARARRRRRRAAQGRDEGAARRGRAPARPRRRSRVRRTPHRGLRGVCRGARGGAVGPTGRGERHRPRGDARRSRICWRARTRSSPAGRWG